jgi:RNAse (barnase) inhibitor barstar
MDHHLSNLQRLIGQRPVDQPPIEVLTHLEMIATSVKELSNNPRNILSDAEQKQLQDVFKLYGSDLRGLWDAMSGDVRTYLAPMEAYFSKFTSAVAPGQPLVLGEVLKNRVKSMESAVASWENAARLGRQQAGPPASFGATRLSTPLRNGTSYGLGGFGQATSFGTPPGTLPQSTAVHQNSQIGKFYSEEPGPPIMLVGMQIKNRTYFKA